VRKVEALLRLASELFRPRGHGDPIICRASKPTHSEDLCGSNSGQSKIQRLRS
jgi:hypothetical protein